MKQKIFSAILLINFLLLTSCNKNSVESQTKEVYQLAEQFLNDNAIIQGIDMIDLQTVTGEPDKSYTIKYGFSDFNGDSIPEFYVTNG